jgi:hypothetical protein
VRLISATNRIYKACGLNDLEQIEDAPEYDPKVVLTAELVEQCADHPVDVVEGERRGDELRGPEGTWRVTSVYRPSEPVYLRADCELIQGEGAHGG